MIPLESGAYEAPKMSPHR